MVEQRRQVPRDAAARQLAARDRGAPGERAVGVRRDDAGERAVEAVAGHGHVLAPRATGARRVAGAGHGDRLAGQQREELLDAHPEQFPERAGVAAEQHVVVGVGDAGEERDEHVRPGSRGGHDRLGVRGLHGVQGRHDEYPVAGQVGAGVHDVRGDPERAQRPVHRLGGVEIGKRGVRHRGALHRPARLGVDEDRDVGGDPAPGDLLQAPEQLAELAHLPEASAVGPGVGHHRRVELLGARPRLPPLEEADGVGAPGHLREGVAQRLAGRLRRVRRLPVDGRRRVLHEDPRVAAGDAAHEVGAERQLRARVRPRVHDVVVG